MKNWIDDDTTLTGETVSLIALDQTHFIELEMLAKDKRIWEFYPYDGTDPDKFRALFNSALIEKEKGTQYPFVIFHKAENKIIGSTRLMNIQPEHKKLEIGFTWLRPDYWGTEVNLECKLLLLTFCFEYLHAVRVQLKTDQNNFRSRKAIEKIGAQFEGILRNDMIRDNNTKRHSAYYSIIDEEWNEKKSGLTQLYEAKRKQAHN